jgi:spermidine synthase
VSDSGVMTHRRRDDRQVVAVTDDVLGRVVVRRDAGRRSVRMLQVDGQAYGAVDLQDLGNLELEYLVLLGAVVEALLPAGPADLLHLGGGAFALPRALATRRPELRQTVVESSAVVIGLAERELGLEPSPHLDVRHDDAGHVVRCRATASTDMVVGDAFVGRRTPRHLATREFATEVARVLRPRGAYVVNLIDDPPWSVVGAHAAVVRTALPHVLAVGKPAVADLRQAGNMLLIASRRPLHRGSLQWRLRQAPMTIDIMSSARLAALEADAARTDGD